MHKEVSVKQIEGLMDAMGELSKSCGDAMERIKASGVKSVQSSNYASALRGFELMLKFVNGVAGTATTAKAKDILYPIMEEMKKVEKDVKRLTAKGSTRAKKK